MNVLGVYVDCDTALCMACYRVEDAAGRVDHSDGWPLAITHDDEADTPTHCAECRALIPHALTGDGYAYVADAVADHRAGLGGNAEVIAQWVDAYC